MSVKVLNQYSSAAADPCSSSFKAFSSKAPLFSKNNSAKEELISSSTSQVISRSSELRRIFCFFDENGDGKISASELQNCMRATGEEFSPEEAEEAVRLSDSDGDGELGLEDFVKLVDAENDQEKEKSLMDAFHMYEMEGRGCITPKSLQRMLRRLGQDPSVEDCTVMIGRFDLNGDGVLSFEEFKIMMQ